MYRLFEVPIRGGRSAVVERGWSEMRVPIVAANWKMNKTVGEAEAFTAKLPGDAELYKKVEVVVCTPFTCLQAVSKELEGTGIKLGAQNMYYEDKGAYTGEISPVMLKDLGCSYVILGHSERRHIFHESNELINKKVKAALTYSLKPILCIGETLEERQAGKMEAVCQTQLFESLKELTEKEMDQIVVAYEPVWAIGTGINASVEDADNTITFVRQCISNKYGEKIGNTIRIQYGGSVKSNNALDYFKQANIDGALIGGASLKADSFYSIVKTAAEVCGC